VSRLVALLVLVAAFAPAAVMGALPLVLLCLVSLTAMAAAVLLVLPQREPLLAGHVDQGSAMLSSRGPGGLPVANHPAGHARHDAAGRHVAADHGVRGEHAPRTDLGAA
jgi:hypothetical protein